MTDQQIVFGLILSGILKVGVSIIMLPHRHSDEVMGAYASAEDALTDCRVAKRCVDCWPVAEIEALNRLSIQDTPRRICKEFVIAAHPQNFKI